MAVLTNSTTFTIAVNSTLAADTTLEVLPVAVSGEGRGRLIHPTLGTFDYPYMPKQWTNMDGNAIIFPDWQTSKTLGSGMGALWPGNIRDVVCKETWVPDGGLSMPMSMLRVLIAMLQNPPDPTSDYVQWWPSYVTTLGFDVIIKNLTVDGQDITFTDVTLQGWAAGQVEITYRLVASAS